MVFNIHVAWPHQLSVDTKEAPSVINALHDCVYIFYSSFRASMLWFIDLTVATCHIQYTFSEFTAIFLTRKLTKQENTRRRLFLYDTKMAADGYWARAQSINTKRASLIH